MNLSSFISSLKNFEKTRDKNHFQEYSLGCFENVLAEFRLFARIDSTRISIVGTNGKGSTAHYLSKIGNKFFSNIGLYTSPHLIHRNERIVLQNDTITDEWIEKWMESLDKQKLKLLESLSFFEFYTLIAIQFFESSNSKFQIYEAGLGGRLDATKLAYSDYLVITMIGLDHEAILGNTKEKILIEKLGITTDKTKKIFYILQEEKLNSIVEQFGKQNNIHCIAFSMDPRLDYLENNFLYSKFILSEILGKKIEVDITTIDPPKARIEMLSENPLVIFDTAHNPEAVKHLLESCEIKFKTKVWKVIVAVLKDKNLEEILDILNKNDSISEILLVKSDEFQLTEKKFSKLKIIESIPRITENTICFGSFRLYEKVIKQLKDNY
ncbi:MAG: bifunctional folylpolyglutamate synthase/dihydrofolate synthase [Leptospiraceae bacterium]|nr:bifunctional folylpolyglutamate synthase/dihydrofolate synthase [Leptospiraceae bacterium]